MSYEEEGQKILEECFRRREEIMKQYEEIDKRHPRGLDGRPSEKPLHEVTVWAVEEIKKLREKYQM